MHLLEEYIHVLPFALTELTEEMFFSKMSIAKFLVKEPLVTEQAWWMALNKQKWTAVDDAVTSPRFWERPYPSGSSHIQLNMKLSYQNLLTF